ncbi:hypothetical protein AB0J38_25970 [Streptomyces sp. NPDC050095]|uniref:hypothetical protein n=1 Tax=unclassified Streptomyces TaxID=2593676 RepID=UPI00343DC737
MIRLISNGPLWALHVADGRAEAVREWARANGIDPNGVPRDADMTIEDTVDGRVIRYTTYVRGDGGRTLVDPARSGEALQEQRVVPLVVKPPTDWPVYAAPAPREG